MQTGTEYAIRRATPADIDLLVPLRLEVLRAANGLAPDAPMQGIQAATRRYYEERLGGEEHIEYLAFVDGQPVACGVASLYTVMPTCDVPTGRRAYIMNMYTRPAYRRRGIAMALLHRLIKAVQSMGIGYIGLEATEAGRPLYKQAGFAPLKNEMVYTGGDNVKP